MPQALHDHHEVMMTVVARDAGNLDAMVFRR
jgi:hypothetical protein